MAAVEVHQHEAERVMRDPERSLYERLLTLAAPDTEHVEDLDQWAADNGWSLRARRLA